MQIIRKFFIVTLSLFCLHTVQADLLDDIATGKYRAKKVEIPTSMKDGEFYTQMTDSQTIVKISYKTGQIVDTLLYLPKTKKPPVTSFEGYILSPKETKILIYKNLKHRYRRSYTAEYLIYDIRYKDFDPLSANLPQESPVFSPDDRYIAFAHKNNLYMKKVDFKTDIRITKDGEVGKIINGIADWVYEEEFENTFYYEWSPDSKLLAFLKFNESEVKEFGFQRFIKDSQLPGFDKQDVNNDYSYYPQTNHYKYPRPGEKNAQVAVCIYDDFNKTTKTIQLNEKDESFYVPRIKWTNSPDILAVFVLNRNQNRLDMLFANPKTALSKLILRQTDKKYIDFKNIDYLKFSSDNQFFYNLSDKDGYNHIYQHKMDGTIARKITSGNWDVTEFYGVNEAKKLVYFQSAEFSPLQRNIFVVDAKGKKTCISSLKGTNNAYFNETFSYFLLSESSAEQPDKFAICNSSGIKIRTLENNTEINESFGRISKSKKEFIKIKTADNIELNAWMLKPENFSSNQKYPLIMVRYSGPGSQEVLDKWSIGWEYYLITRGFIVVSVDGRGTGSRGSEFLKCTYKQMGILEARDQSESAKYFGALPFIDKDRIGIWGWSYGGSTTLWSMSTGEEIFKAGIAVAPVTDWRFYDSAFTERFMSTPEENFEGYEKTSALFQAKNLKGRLLLIHGTADDNVHFQNSLLYADKLVDAGIQFDMQVYTDKNHSILGKTARKHIYRRMAEFFERNL